MLKYKPFIRKHKILLSILSFIFIGLPQYIDSLWSLFEKVNKVSESGMNITWLYAITAPLGLAMLGYIIWQSTRIVQLSLEDVLGLISRMNNLCSELFGLNESQSIGIRKQINNEITMCPNKWVRERLVDFRDAVVDSSMLGILITDSEAQELLDEWVSRLSSYAYVHFKPKQEEIKDEL